MSLTPNVVDGQILLASWGNAIRDRTVQQFTNLAELNTWLAPDGCTARTLDTSILYVRVASAWVPWQTAWANLTLTNGWTTAASLGSVPTPQYRRVNDHIQLRGDVSGGANNSFIATLPVGFRPTYTAFLSTYAWTGNIGFGQLIIQNDGGIKIAAVSTPTAVALMCQIPAN